MNKVALVTGGSRGIGRGIALGLASTGYDLVVNYAGNEAAARQTAADCIAAGKGLRAEICQANIADSADRKKLAGFVKEKFGRLDLLVNNAGVAPAVRADLLVAEEASFDRVLEINLKGPYFLTQLVANWMIEQTQSAARTDEYQPRIVMVSSVSAYAASVQRGEYCVAKAGLAMAVSLYAARLAEFGINVYEIRPGVIATDMTSGVKEKYDKMIAGGLTPIKRWGQPDDVARAVVAVAQGVFPFSTGEVINVDGGFHVRIL